MKKNNTITETDVTISHLLNYYGAKKADKTLDTMLEWLENKYGINFTVKSWELYPDVRDKMDRSLFLWQAKLVALKRFMDEFDG